jgi:glucose/arabinose dehydrogenase
MAGGDQLPFASETVTELEQPWAMTFLPDGRMLVTEKAGRLLLVTADGEQRPISGVPEVDYGGQGGLGDVVLHPQFADNGFIYLSYAEAGEDDTRGAVVVRAELDLDALALSGLTRIWEQSPKTTGRGHYGHRLLFDDQGYLFISSGDRQKFTPAQDMQQNLGKMLRLHDDGSIPADNPFVDQGGVAAEVWSLGLRNPLGMDFDAEGQLWEIEMGPKHGDELNLMVRGENYGYPIVSNGDHYNGKEIPDHDTRPEFAAPAVYWVPAISPGGMIVYKGSLFESWQGDVLVAGLSSKALVRVDLSGEPAEVERFEMGKRIRAVAADAQGAVYLLEDGEDARMLRLTPVVQ